MRRIGLVGAGFISRVHAEALRRIPGLRVIAVIDPVADPAVFHASAIAVHVG